ncbi:helix-turn-helix domain-containing protein [Streptomyces sp. BR1]|uniref:helix-turn-helix domain-containing protein n=1 Tax=Streptomyces sp. BR1 TaxID=1592323 RepID=UPI00402BC234
MPDPGALTTVGEFVQALRVIKVVESLSLRELQRRSGLPRTTIAHALNGERPSLPPWDRVLALLRAFGVAEGELGRWKDTWTRIRLTSTREATAEAGAEAGAEQIVTLIEHPARDKPQGHGQKQDPDAEATVETADVPEAPRARFGPRRRLIAQAGLLALGVGVGAAVVFGITGASKSSDRTSAAAVAAATCSPGLGGQISEPLPPKPTQGDAVPNPPKQRPAWVARPASDAQILDDTDVDLPITTPVRAGDALVVSVMLTSTCPGRVEVTDTKGDEFRLAGDVTDARRHRTMVFVGFRVHPLTTADTIRVVYPHASKYHVAVDEFRGVSEVVGHAESHGEAGGASFSTNYVKLDCAPGDLLVAAVGTNSGTAPTFMGDWSALPVLRLSSYRLSTAYRIAPQDRACAATGRTTAQWGALAVALR